VTRNTMPGLILLAQLNWQQMLSVITSNNFFVKFDGYQNLQGHRTVLSATVRLLLDILLQH